METSRLSDIPGWTVLHRYFRIDRRLWRGLPVDRRTCAVTEFRSWLESVAAENSLQLVPIAGISKSDFGIMAVHPEPSRIQRLEQELGATELGAYLRPVYSFLSISEASEYMLSSGDWARRLIDVDGLDPASEEFASRMTDVNERMSAYAEARVHPQLPADMPVVCFYPMNKARGEKYNWYALDMDQRKKLMGGHGKTGRRFAGRVLQLITTCAGLDDWEWGVTLFARDLKSIRDVVYEMRFDPASALYGQFGPFYVGLRIAPSDLGETLRL